MKKTLFVVLICALSFIMMATNNSFNIPAQYMPVDTIEVKATIYKPSCGTTTADGFKINKKEAGNHKLIAVSRDLKKVLPFGTRVYISGTGELDGLYTVKDLMHQKWKKKIDILVNQEHRLVKWDNIQVIKLADNYQMKDTSEANQL